MVRRIAAVVAVVALCAGNIAVCAGWQATAEARMACCMDANCPMHKAEGQRHSSSNSVGQEQADSCCVTAAQRHDSPAAGSAFADSGVIALVPVVALTLPTTAFVSQEWRTVVPQPVSSTAKHLLLSVFLV